MIGAPANLVLLDTQAGWDPRTPLAIDGVLYFTGTWSYTAPNGTDVLR